MKFGVFLKTVLGVIMSIMTHNASAQNTSNKEKMLLVLAAPSVHDVYYKTFFQKIVDFQLNYARKILENDDVLILVDKDTLKFYAGKIPKENLLEAEIDDIWMRDFTTINPAMPRQFVYTWASMSKSDSQRVQKSFNSFAKKHGLVFDKSDYLLDGGNIVDNYKGKIVTTTRFLEDNYLNKQQGKDYLKKTLQAKEVAILEPDDEVLAHSDGMVSFIDENVLIMNRYKGDEDFQNRIRRELESAFTGVKIIDIPVIFDERESNDFGEFSSACGVNVNAVLTNNALYVPIFNMQHEKEVLELIKANTSKKVITIDAHDVCQMGGSVRCLTWQVMGENALKMRKASGLQK